MKLFCFILSMVICLGMISCQMKEEKAEEMLGDILSEVGGLPTGVVYRPQAEEGDEGYLSRSLTEALYGEDSEICFALIEDYAIYLSSFAAPYEIAVFKSYSKSDALRIEQMCRQRADIVSVALRETEFFSLSGNIRIIRSGATVVFSMTDNPDRSVRLIKRII